jgi:ribonuclease HII
LRAVSGIDEAGRGSVFGSLFVVGVTLDQNSVGKLVKQGLKDSKLFSGLQGRRKRTELALKIQELALELKVKEIPAEEIDQTLKNRPYDNLNYLEIRNIGKIVNDLSSEEITIDSISKPQYLIKHLTEYLKRLEKSLTINIELMGSKTGSFQLKQPNFNIKRIKVSEKADRMFPIVSAASCVAKYFRDKHLREIEDKWGFPPMGLGQGYPHKKDINVMKFLQTYHDDIQAHRFPFIRYSWSWPPLQQIIRSSSQTLEKYFNDQSR